MKKLNSITRLLAVAFMFLTVFALPVKAAENGSITIVDKTHEGELLADIDVQLYKVAELITLEHILFWMILLKILS